MHEASVVQGLLEIVTQAFTDYQQSNPDQRDLKIRRISCEAGLLACFEPQTLKACFEIFAEGTPAEGAELIIETAPLECRCSLCGHEFYLEKRKFSCPLCKSEEITFKGGHGLTLQAVNIEDKNG